MPSREPTRDVAAKARQSPSCLKELCLLDLQGELCKRHEANEKLSTINVHNEVKDSRYRLHMRMGRHIVEGANQELSKPRLILSRVTSSKYKVIGIVTNMFVFSERPQTC